MKIEDEDSIISIIHCFKKMRTIYYHLLSAALVSCGGPFFYHALCIENSCRFLLLLLEPLIFFYRLTTPHYPIQH